MSRISLQIRRSPLGGFSGISRYERRMLGGASRLTVENATFEVERINKAIDDRLSKGRRNVAEFRRQLAECFFKCVEVLRAGKRVLDEKRDDSAHDVTGREKNCTAVVDQVLQRRARIGLVLLVHSVSALDDGGDGDSSADIYETAPQAPNQLDAQCVETRANESVWVWALDPAQPHTETTALAVHRGGKIVAFRRFNAQNADYARV